LNQALEQAARVAMANGARAVLIVPVDLPELLARDVEKMIALGEESPCVVIAPARRDGGTNALLLNPAGLIHFAFGENSFTEHEQRAEQVGARVHVYHSETLAFDLDLPEDLEKFRISTSQSVPQKARELRCASTIQDPQSLDCPRLQPSGCSHHGP